MAKYKIGMSFSWENIEFPASPCRLLLARRVKLDDHVDSLSGLHHHAFWQMETPLSRSLTLLGKTPKAIGEGDVVIIPPGVDHRFRYPDPEATWLTLRFTLEGIQPPKQCIATPRSPWLDSTRTAITQLLDKKPFLGMNERVAVEGLVFSIVSNHLLPEQSKDHFEGSELVQKIKEAVQKIGGEPITIQEIAKELHRSANHITTLFRKSTGMTLKAYIDQQRFRESKRILMYSTSTISETAMELGFPDAFTFSRFFSRMAGQSPSSFREQVLQNRFETEL